jgi:alpha-acetolactate decarboxylase
MFCGKYYVRIDKCVFIVIKIKCVNSSRICDKVNFTTNYTHFTTPDRHLSKHIQYFIRTHTNITNFDTFDGTVPQQDLRISLTLKLDHSH